MPGMGMPFPPYMVNWCSAILLRRSNRDTCMYRHVSTCIDDPLSVPNGLAWLHSDGSVGHDDGATADAAAATTAAAAASGEGDDARRHVLQDADVQGVQGRSVYTRRGMQICAW